MQNQQGNASSSGNSEPHTPKGRGQIVNNHKPIMNQNDLPPQPDLYHTNSAPQNSFKKQKPAVNGQPPQIREVDKANKSKSSKDINVGHMHQNMDIYMSNPSFPNMQGVDPHAMFPSYVNPSLHQAGQMQNNNVQANIIQKHTENNSNESVKQKPIQQNKPLSNKQPMTQPSIIPLPQVQHNEMSNRQTPNQSDTEVRQIEVKKTNWEIEEPSPHSATPVRNPMKDSQHIQQGVTNQNQVFKFVEQNDFVPPQAPLHSGQLPERNQTRHQQEAVLQQPDINNSAHSQNSLPSAQFEQNRPASGPVNIQPPFQKQNIPQPAPISAPIQPFNPHPGFQNNLQRPNPHPQMFNGPQQHPQHPNQYPHQYPQGQQQPQFRSFENQRQMNHEMYGSVEQTQFPPLPFGPPQMHPNQEWQQYHQPQNQFNNQQSQNQAYHSHPGSHHESPKHAKQPNFEQENQQVEQTQTFESYKEAEQVVEVYQQPPVTQDLQVEVPQHQNIQEQNKNSQQEPSNDVPAWMSGLYTQNAANEEDEIPFYLRNQQQEEQNIQNIQPIAEPSPQHNSQGFVQQNETKQTQQINQRPHQVPTTVNTAPPVQVPQTKSPESSSSPTQRQGSSARQAPVRTQSILDGAKSPNLQNSTSGNHNLQEDKASGPLAERERLFRNSPPNKFLSPPKPATPAVPINPVIEEEMKLLLQKKPRDSAKVDIKSVKEPFLEEITLAHSGSNSNITGPFKDKRSRVSARDSADKRDRIVRDRRSRETSLGTEGRAGYAQIVDSKGAYPTPDQPIRTTGPVVAAQRPAPTQQAAQAPAQPVEPKVVQIIYKEIDGRRLPARIDATNLNEVQKRFLLKKLQDEEGMTPEMVAELENSQDTLSSAAKNANLKANEKVIPVEKVEGPATGQKKGIDFTVTPNSLIPDKKPSVQSKSLVKNIQEEIIDEQDEDIQSKSSRRESMRVDPNNPDEQEFDPIDGHGSPPDFPKANFSKKEGSNTASPITNISDPALAALLKRNEEMLKMISKDVGNLNKPLDQQGQNPKAKGIKNNLSSKYGNGQFGHILKESKSQEKFQGNLSDVKTLAEDSFEASQFYSNGIGGNPQNK